MKIQCNVCEAAEATVLCCADEAALCSPCDLKVHAANKLAGKHQRVPLSSSSSSHFPNCDICQEAAGFFFCLEDRALLCRKCDLAIHTANEFVSSHQRFLLTGVKVGPDTTTTTPPPPSPQHSHPCPETKSSSSLSNHSGHPPSADLNNHPPPPANGNGIPTFIPSKLPISGGSSGGSVGMWTLDEFLPFGDFNQGYSFMGDGSSKADSSKLGDSDCSSVLRSSEEPYDNCLGQVPDNPWAVPQMPSPPTASGLHWPKTLRQRPDAAAAAFVPDISCAPDVGCQFYGNRRRSKYQRRC